MTVLCLWILLFSKWLILAFFVTIWLLPGSAEVPKFTQPRQFLFTKQTFETRKKRFQNAGIEKTSRFCRFDGFSCRKKASKWIGASHRKGKSIGPIRKFNFQRNITEFDREFYNFSTQFSGTCSNFKHGSSNHVVNWTPRWNLCLKISSRRKYLGISWIRQKCL